MRRTVFAPRHKARPERPVEWRLRPEDRVAIRAAIRMGRAATRAGNLAEARTHFDRALALNPNDAGVHCEAGFAAVNGHGAEERRYAREHLEHGLALLGRGEPPPVLRVPMAMCLYNRGLLAER